MSSKRFLVAFTFGLGLGLTACAGEQDSDLDLDADPPEMHVMGGGDTLPPGSGSGPNGSNPAPHCLKAMVQAMSYFAAGWEPGPGGPGTAVGTQKVMYNDVNGNPVYGTTYPYNSNLWWVRCDDTLQDPYDNLYPYPRLLGEADTLKAMTWAGASKDRGIDFNGTTYWGTTSWFARNWGGDGWSNLMAPANRDILGGVLAAKWNYNQGVMIRLQIPAFDGQGSDLTVGGGYPEYFDLFEMMIVFDPEAPAQSFGAVATYPSPGLHVFLGSGVAEHCAYTDQYFRRRLCHNGGYCPYQQIALPQSSIPSLCKKADGTAATGVHDASTCYGGLRTVKVFVNSWNIENLGVCQG